MKNIAAQRGMLSHMGHNTGPGTQGHERDSGQPEREEPKVILLTILEKHSCPEGYTESYGTQYRAGNTGTWKRLRTT